MDKTLRWMMVGSVFVGGGLALPLCGAACGKIEAPPPRDGEVRSAWTQERIGDGYWAWTRDVEGGTLWMIAPGGGLCFVPSAPR